MENEENKKLITGYIIGAPLFLIILPLAFYFLSKKLDLYLNNPIIENFSIQIILSLVLLIIGLSFSFWSIIVQYKIGKGGPLEGCGVSVSPKTKKLNTTGPYKYTRNPMLFGTCAFYFSLALFFNSISFLLLTCAFAVFMVIFVKITEEKRLLADFGEEYEMYRKKTPFLIPTPPKK